MPFATIVTKDYTGFDTASDLNRPGVFRLNVGVGRDTFRALFGDSRRLRAMSPTISRPWTDCCRTRFTLRSRGCASSTRAKRRSKPFGRCWPRRMIGRRSRPPV